MCVITSIALSTAAVVLGAVIGTTSVIQNVKNQENAINISKQNAEIQAKAERDQASYLKQQAINKSRIERLNSIRNANDIKSKTASGNINVNSMNSSYLSDDEIYFGELDAINTLNSANSRANMLENKAQNRILNVNMKNYSSSLDTFNNYGRFTNGLLDSINSIGGVL